MKTYRILIQADGEPAEQLAERLATAAYYRTAQTVEEKVAAHRLGLPFDIDGDGNLLLAGDFRMEFAELGPAAEWFQRHAWLLMNYWTAQPDVNPTDAWIQGVTKDNQERDDE